MPQGRIVRILAGKYNVETDGKVTACTARGRFRIEEGKIPLVGDEVEFVTRGTGNMITEILPRRNEFIRPRVANIDALVIVASGAIPVTAPFLFDRMILTAERAPCNPVVAINKIDLAPADDLSDIYTRAGFDVFRVCAETGEGIGALLESLSGRVCALAGNSGVGKTSLLRAMGLTWLAVGEVSEKLGRGRHTTRHVELHHLDNGAMIIDTPGFSSFEALDEHIPPDELASYFRDFAEYLGNCRFRDCAHRKEPGCAVREAVDNGGIMPTRYESYLKLLDISDIMKSREYK